MPLLSDHMIPKRLELLDTYLSTKESRVSKIRDGCEKKIIWYNNEQKQRDLAIVYVHGFSASRMEIWPLCDRLAKVLGANLFYTQPYRSWPGWVCYVHCNDPGLAE